MINEEGADSLTDDELGQACSDRGLKVLGMSSMALKEQLKEWISFSTVRPQLVESFLIYAHSFDQRELHLQPLHTTNM